VIDAEFGREYHDLIPATTIVRDCNNLMPELTSKSV
jgi:hypothetical protein